ncbi:cupin domain-containing protein [Microtetraspora niveoalba]|uniref:cupin domain-containing protein n=1 Tax=Microtetraspora niveoalba TaxID=46175 RepID=UPI000831F82E|nr:cupin domain-containing protein [Microtetraspora niveoalba]
MRIARRPTTSVAAPSQWITGDAWIEPVAELGGASRSQIDSVRFAPGGRTVWHRHPLGQVLVVTEGTGRVQRCGGPVETIHAGDTVHIAPGEWHWHGAAPTVPVTHLAIEPIPEDGAVAEAGAPVTDNEYHRDDHVAGAEAIPPVTRSVLLDQLLSAPQDTHRVEVRRIVIAPGHAGGLHVHNGPVFGSIETGSAVYQIEGEAASVLGPGDVFYEPKAVRIARFDAQDEGVTFLGYFLLSADETPEIEFPDL